MLREILNLYDKPKTRVRVRSAHSEEFEVKVGVHQGSMLSRMVFALIVDVITKNAKTGEIEEV